MEPDAIAEQAASLDGWIPQLFYDLIGRVVPGAAILVSVLFLPFDHSVPRAFITFLFKDSGTPTAIAALAWLLASYLVGVLLGAIGFCISGREWRVKPIELSALEPPDLSDENSRHAYMYDAVQFRAPRVGARLAKLRAEKHMCRVMLVGFSMMTVFHVLLNSYAVGSISFWFVLGALGATIVSSYLFYRHLDIRTTRLLWNQWHLLGLAPSAKNTERDEAAASNPSLQPTPVATTSRRG